MVSYIQQKTNSHLQEVIYMALSHLTSADFDQAVNAGDDVVVVDFFATWCGPCKMLAPAVERMAEVHPEVHFGVMSVPTLLYFKRGEIVNKTVGLISPADLENAIAKSK